MSCIGSSLFAAEQSMASFLRAELSERDVDRCLRVVVRILLLGHVRESELDEFVAIDHSTIGVLECL